MTDLLVVSPKSILPGFLDTWLPSERLHFPAFFAAGVIMCQRCANGGGTWAETILPLLTLFQRQRLATFLGLWLLPPSLPGPKMWTQVREKLTALI